VVALEGAAGYVEPAGQGVELVEVGVAHQVAPPATAPWPAALVDETGHGGHDGGVEEELRDRWAADAGRGRAATTALDSLLGRYREPPRRYHGTAHVLRVLRTVEEILAAMPDPAVPDPAAVRLAAWYHDAIYDPRAAAGANEAASAALAERDLASFGMAPERVASVARLVRVTAGHEPATPDEAVLCDADLAVLAADPATYTAYATGVRAEYGHVDEAAWRVGRAEVLSAFLARPVLFHTTAMAPRDGAARANLTAELATLT
jgi:predicted metal-dependent HD superfamily phosphohydrolase